MIDEGREDRTERRDTESEELNRQGGNRDEQPRREAASNRAGFTADELESSTRGRREEESGEVF